MDARNSVCSTTHSEANKKKQKIDEKQEEKNFSLLFELWGEGNAPCVCVKDFSNRRRLQLKPFQ